MAAEFAQLTSGSNILWSGGQLFNGYVLLIMSLPSTSGAAWTRVMLKDARPKTRVPSRIKIPIREGQYEPDTKIWRTDSLVPPHVVYSAFFYDDSDRLISAGAELFSVETATYDLEPPTLTDPTVASSSVQPEDVPSSQVTTLRYGVPTREDVQGTKNGVNTAFTISKDGAVVLIIWNQTVLDEGVHYTRSTTSITMIAPFLPGSGDTLEAVIW